MKKFRAPQGFFIVLVVVAMLLGNLNCTEVYAGEGMVDDNSVTTGMRQTSTGENEGTTLPETPEEPTTPQPPEKPVTPETPEIPKEPEVVKPTLQLSQKKITLYTGKVQSKLQITAKVTGSSKQVRWMSGDSGVAKVDARGRVTAVKKGRTLISATANGITRSVTVLVKDPTIHVTKGGKKISKVSVKTGKTYTVKVAVDPKKSGIKIANRSKSSKRIAAVRLSNGKLLITGKRSGTIRLKLVSGRATKIITVKVEQPVVQSPYIFVGGEMPYYIKVNRQANCVTIYGRDQYGTYSVPIKAMVCSVGVNNETPLGVFQTSSKYIWRPLFGGVYGQYAFRINGPILFHTVPYTTTYNNAIEYDEYNKLGQAASMGCVRLTVSDMKWIYDNCPCGTMVEIYDSPDPGPLGKPQAMYIDPNSPYRGWDPTDPDPNNPWRTIPPTIHGVTKQVVERGEKVDYMKNITATDYLGEAVTVKKIGIVKSKKCGKYTVTYVAMDKYGNVSSKKTKFVVKDTVKPTISVLSNVKISDKNAGTAKKQILESVSAKDGKDKLSSKYVVVDMTKLKKAISGKKYGTYICTAYAKDKAKNKSNKVKIIVTYQK